MNAVTHWISETPPLEVALYLGGLLHFAILVTNALTPYTKN